VPQTSTCAVKEDPCHCTIEDDSCSQTIKEGGAGEGIEAGAEAEVAVADMHRGRRARLRVRQQS
jgi:hypothetical protein